VVLELGEALTRLGWAADYAGPESIGADTWYPAGLEERRRLLTGYLRGRAAEFDVLDYDHAYGPADRRALPADRLLVARSVLLIHNVARAAISHRPGLRRWAGNVLLSQRRRVAGQRAAAVANEACAAADLVNVCNSDEAAVLRRHDIPAEKVVVFPFGLTASRRTALESVPLTPPDRPCVAFVGTFDPRKGMREFPRIVTNVLAALPDCRFKLMGTKGMLRTANEVLASFPRRARRSITVVPEFQPAELPRLLGDCSVGVFPSAVEGFPFGVLEMIACGLPVVAYRAPGAPMMLPDDDLMPVRDAAGIAARVVSMLSNPEMLTAARAAARRRSRDFDWDRIARQTAATYEERLTAVRRGGN
jgi:glycosyltransferase involved in cell wall biosynthesis